MHSVYKISGEGSNQRKLVVAMFVFESDANDWADKKNEDMNLSSTSPYGYVVEEGNRFGPIG